MPTNDERIQTIEDEIRIVKSSMDALTTSVHTLVKLQTEDGPWRDNTKRWMGRLCFVQKLTIAALIGGATVFGGFVAGKLWNIESGQKKVEKALAIEPEKP